MPQAHLTPPLVQGEESHAVALSAAQWAQLCTHLESRLEQVRAAAARTLHDDLGGLLIAAKMELGHAERALREHAPELAARVSSAQHSLDAVIAAERRLVEELQPGLLVHIGLFAALRWYVGRLNSGGAADYEADLPAQEPPLDVATRVVLYRAAQDALALGNGAPMRMIAGATPDSLSLAFGPLHAQPGNQEDIRLLAIRHRVLSAGGDFSLAGGTLAISMPRPA